MKLSRCAALALAMAATSAHDAAAKVVAEASMSGGAVVLLHGEAGPCVGGALFAEYVAADGARVPGCWVKRPGHVSVVFFDGDVGAVPEGALRLPKTS